MFTSRLLRAFATRGCRGSGSSTSSSSVASGPNCRTSPASGLTTTSSVAFRPVAAPPWLPSAAPALRLPRTVTFRRRKARRCSASSSTSSSIVCSAASWACCRPPLSKSSTRKDGSRTRRRCWLAALPGVRDLADAFRRTSGDGVYFSGRLRVLLDLGDPRDMREPIDDAGEPTGDSVKLVSRRPGNEPLGGPLLVEGWGWNLDTGDDVAAVAVAGGGRRPLSSSSCSLMRCTSSQQFLTVSE